MTSPQKKRSRENVKPCIGTRPDVERHFFSHTGGGSISTDRLHHPPATGDQSLHLAGQSAGMVITSMPMPSLSPYSIADSWMKSVCLPVTGIGFDKKK